MSKVYNLLFAGVGGQGSLLSAELTSLAATQHDYDVKQTEVHGVSQRGGSVETHVRFGPKIHSPVVTPGEADVVVALEKLESLRFAHYVNPRSGMILVNDYEIIPGSVSGAEQTYPHNAVETLREHGLPLISLQATQIADKLGDGRMANVVMLGALYRLLPLSEDAWQKALRMRIPDRYLEANLRAFAVGRKQVQSERVGS